MDLGGACAVRRNPGDGCSCAKSVVHASHGGTGYQNVGNCSRHEPGSAAHWLDRKIPYEPGMRPRNTGTNSALPFDRAPQASDNDTSRAVVGGRFDTIVDIEDEF